MTSDYFLIIKTGQAEIRAIENTSRASLQELFPVIELTRGRKKTLDDNTTIHPFDSRLNRLKEAFRGLNIAIDATSDDALSCAEIDTLFDSNNGYQNWVDFVWDLDAENVFSAIVPALIMNYDDSEFLINLRKEVDSLSRKFDTLLYRCSIEDSNCYTDLPEILKQLPKEKRLIVLIDCGYTPQAMEDNVTKKLLKRITNLKDKILDSRCSLAFCATSFPNNISEIGDLTHDVFRISEAYMHEKVLEQFPDVHYGDYGSINPKRNDNIVMARGWIPRIDVPLTKEVYYYRRRRAGSSYAEAYEKVAAMVMSDSAFPKDLLCWGISQIDLCEMSAPAATPNYWISVRMNIHIEQQLRRLKLLDCR